MLRQCVECEILKLQQCILRIVYDCLHSDTGSFFFFGTTKLDDLTQDLTVSQLSDVADYLEDVA